MVPFKKHLTFLVLILGLFSGLMAHPVDQETARAIAVRFMGTDNITLSSTYRTTNNDPAFYIFNTIDGFVIVSADDCETPIIGYSHESRFNPDDIPVQMEDYLRDFAERIQYGIDNQVVANETTAKQWKLVKVTGRLNDNRSAKAVEPLLTTKWHQGCLYNSLCPEISGPCGHAEVGCVAVAMGQIMNYWKYPEGGNESHSYTSTLAGTLSADFGSTLYHWGLMPDTLTEASSEAEVEAVATLLYHCGIAVEMNYSTSGSGAYTSDVPDALRHYFKYADSLHLEKPNDDLEGWLDQLKQCLDLQRPVYYSGSGSGGHAFVCDGYDANDLLHFNWGWGGNSDGYFALGNLNPTGHNYSSSNKAILDIVPNYELHLVSATANPPEAGTIEGQGYYHWGQQCRLIANPTGNYHIHHWTRNGLVVSYDSIYSLFAMNDILNIEAIFTLDPVVAVTAQVFPDPDDACVSLSWGSRDNNSWALITSFSAAGAGAVATDGNFIYIYTSDQVFRKHSMEGTFVKRIRLDVKEFNDFTCNGNLFYSNAAHFQVLQTLNMSGQSVLNDIPIPRHSPICSYDKVNKGIWICEYNDASSSYKLKLVDRSGTIIKTGQTLPESIVPNGAGCLTDVNGKSHLLLKTQRGLVYDYDADNDLFVFTYLTDLGDSYGCHVDQYQGKDAMFVCYGNQVKIFEIPTSSILDQILHYRIYRTDEKSNMMVLSDKVTNNGFIDSTWKELPVGLYRYGVTEVYRDGSEADIKWSNPIPKGNYDINETPSPDGPTVQKVIEDGQVVIIKDGKKYTITGQTIQ